MIFFAFIFLVMSWRKIIIVRNNKRRAWLKEAFYCLTNRTVMWLQTILLVLMEQISCATIRNCYFTSYYTWKLGKHMYPLVGKVHTEWNYVYSNKNLINKINITMVSCMFNAPIQIPVQNIQFWKYPRVQNLQV